MTRPGIVLVITVLALTALALLIAAFVFVAGQEVLTARARAASIRARAAAASAARATLAGWSTARYRALQPGQTMEAPTPAGEGLDRAAASVERLGPGAFLIRAVGESGLATARAGVRVRALDMRELLAPFPAALTTGATVDVLPDARIDAEGVAGAAPTADGACDPLVAGDTLAAVFGADAHPAIVAADASLVDSAPGTLIGDPELLVAPDAFPTDPEPGPLGPLAWDDLARLADRIETGVLAPAPVDDGADCDRAAVGNWGDPLDPAAPCAAWFPLAFAPADLTLDGGVGQGVLVVRGTLVMRGGARFFGAVVAGAIDVDPGAGIEGAVRIAGSAPDGTPASRIAGSIAYRACPLLDGLLRSAFDRPLRPAGRWWIPLF